MGTTIVAAWLKNGRLSLAHVGDSRAYLLRGGALEQLTADHSLVAENVRRGIMTPQEAETSNLQSVLIRALGSGAEVQVDVSENALLEGDMLVLCSDGLTRMVTDPEIASTMTTVEPAQAAANRLIELANEYGGVDNVTVIVVRILPGANGLLARLKRWTTGATAGPRAKVPRRLVIVFIPGGPGAILPERVYPGGHRNSRPPSKCMCRWKTDCPAARPLLITVR